MRFHRTGIRVSAAVKKHMNTGFSMTNFRIRSAACIHITYTKLDIDRMNAAAGYLIGEHDFKSFCSIHTQTETTVRTITDLSVKKEGSLITIRVTGTGFLYNMVRIIAGTLIEVGNGKYPPEHIKEILKHCDRSCAGPTAPARGLTLVEYEFL